MTGARALVVEDDPAMAALLTRALGSVSIDALSAADEVTAISSYRSGDFDVVLADYNLPGGNGRTLVHGLRRLDPDVPILLMSGRIEKKELAEVIGESIDEFLEKPLEITSLLAAVERLVGIGRERRRARRSGAALLQLSSSFRVAVPSRELLPLLARCATEVSPFQKSAIYLSRAGSPVLRAESVCGAEEREYPDLRREEMAALFSSGVKRGNAAFVARDGERPAGEHRWAPGDRILSELRSSQRLWGYLCLESPRDERLTLDDAMPLASLLASYVANVLDNRSIYELETRRRYQLETIGQLVETSLRSRDIDVTMTTLAEAAVRRFGNAFACFLERTPDGAGFAVRHPVFRAEPFTAAGTVLPPEAARRVARVAEARKPLHLRSGDEVPSLVGSAAHRCSLAFPIFTGKVLRHVFVIEDDARPEFDEHDVLAYRTMTDQIGLVWSRLLYQRYLETTKTELERSYGKLQEAHGRNVRLQEIVRRFLPSSTWDFAEKTIAEGTPAEGQVRDLVVVFVDISGFTPLAERAPSAEILRLLNTYFTLVSGIVTQHGGEVVKYIGDGVMASFAVRRDAFRAADDVLKSQDRLNTELGDTSLGPVRLKIGMSFGPLLQGNVGPFYHQDRTLLGDTVNTASRLENRAEPGTALIDAGAVPEGEDLAALGVVEIPSLVLKGKSRPVPVVTFARDQAVYKPRSAALAAQSPGADEVLVVDDDPEMLAFVSRCLGGAGYQVRTALGGREALAQMERSRPALIICDVQMPEMNGFDFCRQVRAGGNGDVPFIFCSVLSGVPQRVAGLQLGADDYMLKPVDPSELVVRVEAQLQRSRVLRRLLREAQRHRDGVILAGSLAEVGVPQILQTVEGLGTGGVRVRMEVPDGRTGEIYLLRSDLVHAETAGGGERRIAGEKAFLRMLGWNAGTFSVEHVAWTGEPTLSSSVQRVLLEGLAQLDEERLLRRTLAPPGYARLAVPPGADLFTRRFDIKTIQVLCVLEKTSRVDDVLDASPLGDLETLRILAALVHSGLLVPETG